MGDNWENQLNMDWNDPENWLSQSLGDREHIYTRCGYNAFMGTMELCPECRQAKDHGCGRQFAVAEIRGVPDSAR